MMYNPPAGWRSLESLNTRTESDTVSPVETPDAAHGSQGSFHVIKTEMGFENGSELYYRLEQIRLLGFVEKEKLRESASSTVWIYKLAEPYSTLLGSAKADETGFAVIT